MTSCFRQQDGKNYPMAEIASNHWKHDIILAITGMEWSIWIVENVTILSIKFCGVEWVQNIDANKSAQVGNFPSSCSLLDVLLVTWLAGSMMDWWVTVRWPEGSLLRRVITLKSHYSEGSLLRIEHKKGHCSEGSLLRRVIAPKGHVSELENKRRQFWFCWHRLSDNGQARPYLE